jgi:acetoin utilization deacetylase AcuC-like enzyme
MSSSAAPAASAADLHVIYAQHDLTDDLSGEGQGVNKPVVRKRNIIDALKQSASDDANASISFEALSEPAESLQAAERVHAPQLLRFFATGFERWAELCKAGQADLYFSSAGRVSPPDWSELVPSQCAPRDAHQRPGSSVHGECNYYAQDAMTPITEHTSKILHHDLAVTMAAVAAIASGSRRQVYACTTQPGHHSGPESYGGYCYVNQAALATRMLQESMGKVALLDVDYHAGNGSMAIFHDDPQVYFASSVTQKHVDI